MKHSKAIRLTSLITTIIFTWTSFFWSAPPAYSLPEPAGKVFPADFQNLKLPPALGTIEEKSTAQPATKTPFVIYIQDAHAVYDAQKSIQRIIAYLQKEFRLPLVAVEGAVGPLDPVLYRTFPVEKIKSKIFDSSGVFFSGARLYVR